MMTRSTVVRLAAPACPQHGDRLDGGPVLFWCPASGHSVQAADIDNEFAPRPRPVLYNAPVIAAFAWAISASWINFVFWTVI